MMTRRLIKTAAGVFIGLVIFTPQTLAAEVTSQLRMVLPCFPTAAWAKMTRTTNLTPVDTRTDDDGDVWIMWLVKSGHWRATVTIQRGEITCILGGRGLIKKPARKTNI